MRRQSSGPTVFLVVTQGFAARYLLHTDILPTLLAAGARVVVLAPNAGDASMAAEFTSDRVGLEPLHASLGRIEQQMVQYVVSRARMNALAGRSGAFVNRYERFRRVKREKNPVVVAAVNALVQLASHSRTVRKGLVGFEERRYAVPVHAEAFERHRPDLVVTASVGYVKEDAIVMREARRRGVPSVGVVMGWDNPSSKGYRGATPDRIVAWSDRMAGLVADLQDFPRERIFVGGVAHFDRYVRPGSLPTRDELVEQLGLDPVRKIVLYATSSPGAWRRNVDVAEVIAQAIRERRLGVEAQLVVRVHPNFFRADTPASVEGFERLAAEHEHVHIDRPGVLPGGMRVRLAADDAVRLGGLIKHADCLVNMFSTTTVEACLCDTPVVQVTQHAWDPPDERFTSGARQRWFEYLHMRRVVERTAARTADSPHEIVERVRDYLVDPGLDRAARLDAARVECGPTDGHAGERIAGFLLGLVGADPAPAAPRVSAAVKK
jgi:hypothetical protein